MILDTLFAGEQNYQAQQLGVIPEGAKILYGAADYKPGTTDLASATVIYIHEGQCYERYRDDTTTEVEIAALSKAYVRGLLDAAYLNMLDALGPT